MNVDVAVIGAGTAGLAAYRAAKRAGASVVLIEGGPVRHHLRARGLHAEQAVDRCGGSCASRDDGAALRRSHRTAACASMAREVMARVRSERDRFVGFS